MSKHLYIIICNFIVLFYSVSKIKRKIKVFLLKSLKLRITQMYSICRKINPNMNIFKFQIKYIESFF